MQGVNLEETGVDSKTAERRLHVVNNPPDFQISVADHRHCVVVVAEVRGVGELVRMRGVR